MSRSVSRISAMIAPWSAASRRTRWVAARWPQCAAAASIAQRLPAVRGAWGSISSASAQGSAPRRSSTTAPGRALRRPGRRIMISTACWLERACSTCRVSRPRSGRVRPKPRSRQRARQNDSAFPSASTAIIARCCGRRGTAIRAPSSPNSSAPPISFSATTAICRWCWGRSSAGRARTGGARPPKRVLRLSPTSS